MQNVRRIEHPLVAHHLTQLRDRATPPSEFRALVQRLSFLLVCEACQELTTQPVRVTTPVTETDGARLNQRIAVVPILRAGLSMVTPVLELLPEAEIWHLGVYRDEKELTPIEYYHKLPRKNPVDVAMVVDPMLATGGSAAWAVGALKKWGVPHIKMLCLLAAPEGLEHLTGLHPDIVVHCCSIDDHLNDKGYIVPGLGDAGDRCFNTMP